MSQQSRTVSSYPAALLASDDGRMIIAETAGGAGALTGPPSSGPSVAPQGAWIDIRVKGANVCTFTPQTPHTVEGSADIELPGNSVTRLWHDKANGEWFRQFQRS